MHRFERLVRTALGWIAWTGGLLAAPVARLALAIPFLKSGLTKWSGWFHVSPVADFLFSSMFQLHIFGHLYPFPIPDVLAHIDAVTEILFPVLLIAGLATRFSALSMLVMIGVIQLTDPSGWANFHLPWAGLALAIMALGPGKLSLDFAIERWIKRGRDRVTTR
jgi:putative oxidoreductase